MLRFFWILLIISVSVWLGLHQCTNVSQHTLVLKPAASFPQEKSKILGQTMARILPHCPGFQKLGAVLEFTNIAEDGDAVMLHFSTPDSQAIPTEWHARGQQCTMRVGKNGFSLGTRAACQALCLGEPGMEGQDVYRELGSEAK